MPMMKSKLDYLDKKESRVAARKSLFFVGRSLYGHKVRGTMIRLSVAPEWLGLSREAHTNGTP